MPNPFEPLVKELTARKHKIEEAERKGNTSSGFLRGFTSAGQTVLKYYREYQESANTHEKRSK